VISPYSAADAGMPTKTPKTPNQRKAEERARYKAEGRVPVQVWVFPSDRARVQSLAELLNSYARAKDAA